MLKDPSKLFGTRNTDNGTPSNSDVGFHICRVLQFNGSDGFTDIVALLPKLPEGQFWKDGIPGPTIAGIFTDLLVEGEKLDPGKFRQNRPFMKVLHEVIATNAPADLELKNAARQQHTGSLCILDGRTPTPQGEVPPRDIIGAFEVKDGVIVPDSYQANPNYRLLSSDGFLRLNRSLQAALCERLTKSAAPGS